MTKTQKDCKRETARLSISLLGSFHVTLDGKAVTSFTSDKARALLAYLAVEARRPHRRDALAGLLWPDYLQASARGSLRSALASLRRATGDRDEAPPFLHVSRQTIQFNCESDAWLDVAAFTGLLEPGIPGAQNMQRLEEAAALYRGEFLEGFSLADSSACEEWALLTREQLRRMAVEALDRLVGCYESTGEFELALPHAWRQVELDSWRGRARRQLMRLLAFTGQRGAALEQYETYRQLLAEELGAEPAPETTALHKRILTSQVGAAAEATALPPHNLPRQPTPFVEREPLLAEIGEQLQDPTCRLLTLVGPGGSGKTRLALEAAVAQLERYPDGVFFVSLAPLESDASIIPTVADAIGFTFFKGGEPRQQLLDYLYGKKMLLVMDNFEHLLEPSITDTGVSSPEAIVDTVRDGADGSTQRRDGALLVTAILGAAPNVKILATSRARLNVGGEHRYPIPGMRYPALETPAQGPEHASHMVRIVGEAAGYCAIKLFLQGAHRAKPGFELTEQNLGGVVRICHLVEGMPLAIRLAAPWVSMLSPDEIAAELAFSLDLLATDRRDVPARQRSARATLDYSWRMVGERRRELMQALSVFPGGFTWRAAQAVTGATLHELISLADRSLFQPTSAGRFGIHELLRQYAREKLNQTPDGGADVRNRHCAYYAAALKGWAEDLKGARQQTALAEIEVDVENARSAWDWALKKEQVEQLGQALDGLCRFYDWRGRAREGEAACRAAANVVEPASHENRLRLLVRILAWQSVFCESLGRVDAAGELLERCQSLLEAPDTDARAERALILARIGMLAYNAGDNTKAKRMFGESLDLYQALGDRWGEAAALANQGWVPFRLGYYDEGKGWVEKSLALRQSLGDTRGIASALDLMGLIAAYSGDMEGSVQVRREIMAIRNQIGDRSGSARGLHNLATGLIWTGEFAEAEALLQEYREIFDDLGSRVYAAAGDVCLGWIDVQRGRYEQARVRFDESLLVFRGSGWRDVGVALLFRGMLALADRDKGAARDWLEEAADLFKSVGQRDEWAIAIASLAYVARAQGDRAQAREYLWPALQTGAELHASTGLTIMPLPAAALLLADMGEKELAVEIYALAKRYPYIARSRFYEDIVGRHIAVVAASLPPDVVTAARERGRARNIWATAEELAEKFRSPHHVAPSSPSNNDNCP